MNMHYEVCCTAKGRNKNPSHTETVPAFAACVEFSEGSLAGVDVLVRAAALPPRPGPTDSLCSRHCSLHFRTGPSRPGLTSLYVSTGHEDPSEDLHEIQKKKKKVSGES